MVSESGSDGAGTSDGERIQSRVRGVAGQRSAAEASCIPTLGDSSAAVDDTIAIT